MYFLIYFSVATRPFTPEELVDLLEVSRKNNTAAKITGMLLYKDEKFMQLLEGEEGAVARVFEKISRDRRHRSVTVLLEGEAPERAFSVWSMGFENLDTAAAQALPGYSEYLYRPLTADAFPNPSEAQRMLRIFKRTTLSM